MFGQWPAPLRRAADRASAGQLAKPSCKLWRGVFSLGLGDVRAVVSALSALDHMRCFAQPERNGGGVSPGAQPTM